MKENKTLAIIKRFAAQIKPYRGLILLTTLCGVLKQNIVLVFPWAFGKLIDGVLLSTGPMGARLHTLSSVSLLLLVVCIVLGVVTYFRFTLGGKVGNQFIFDLRYRLFEHIQKMSLNFFEKHKTGGIISYIINDINIAQNIVGNAITNTFMDCSVLVTLLIVMFAIHPKMALVSILIFPFYVYHSNRLNKKIKETSREVQERLEQLSGSLHERISGIKVTKSFTAEQAESQRFYDESKGYFENIMEGVHLQAKAHTVTEFLVRLAPIIVFWYGGTQYLKGEITLGTLIAFYGYLAPFYLPLTRLTELNVILQNSIVAMERIYGILDTLPEVSEDKDAHPLVIQQGRVIFKHVSFSYNPEREALLDINAEVEPGSLVALVGPSGSGKTTLVNLLLRFYDPGIGSIRIDGMDIRHAALKSLREQIGVVLQETVLFSGTLEENIRYGKPLASREEILQAAKSAHADEFIARLPKGYQTEAGECGNQLSVGQKQRIALARVFLKDPRILILDEATSSLDSISESFVQEALGRLLKGRTTFVIAHRISTIMNADIIWVMQHGKILQTGNHQSLAGQPGLYQDLCQKQFHIPEAERDMGSVRAIA